MGLVCRTSGKLGFVSEGLTTLRKNKKAIANCLFLSGVINFSVVVMWPPPAIGIPAPFYIFLSLSIVNLTTRYLFNGFG
jgi:hypothetical protein